MRVGSLPAGALAFAAVLGSRVRLNMIGPRGQESGMVELDLVAVDAVGIYGCLVGLPGLVEFWPWHRIASASGVKVQGELLGEDRGSAAGAGAAQSAANPVAAPGGDVPDPSELPGF